MTVIGPVEDALVQIGRWCAAFVALASERVQAGVALESLSALAMQLHEEQPTLFSQALLSELRTRGLLAPRDDAD